MIDIQKLKKEESFKDQCGVFGIFAPGENVAKITYVALHSLQHRGQESAGIAVSDGNKLRSIRKLGLVNAIFNEQNLSKLSGFVAIGHNRYSTTGGNTINNIQPIILPNNGDFFGLAHNGNLTNSNKLLKHIEKIKRISTTDSEIMGIMIARANPVSWGKKILSVMPYFEGAYSTVCLSRDRLYAFRDPWGIRPLILGKLNGSFVVASESCTFDTLGAKMIREVKPGEVISIGKDGLIEEGRVPQKSKKFCLFEYVYLARPDSIMNDMLVHQARARSGELLAAEAPVEADLVVAIPDSGTSAAIGFSRATGIPFGEALIKNRYIGRTFISPDQHMREQGVKMKFNPMREILTGKRIVIVDDSIVRGTTIRKIIEIIRKCDVKEIHLRICSPPIRWPCFFGVDTPERRQLIASEKTVAQIKEYINADSLHYLSLEGLIKASKQPGQTLCAACFSGKYPMKVNHNFTKNIFENC